MTAIAICGKPSQTADIRRAVGTRYGEIFPCHGHLLHLAEPGEDGPVWNKAVRAARARRLLPVPPRPAGAAEALRRLGLDRQADPGHGAGALRP